MNCVLALRRYQQLFSLSATAGFTRGQVRDRYFLRALPFRNRSGTQGFTLIELIIALAIGAVLLSMALPNLQPAIRSMRLTGDTHDFIADMQYARSEALKRAGVVVVCTATDTTGCIPGNWQAGRLIFFDANADGILNLAPGSADEALRFRERSENNFTIVPSVAGMTSLAFNGRGTLVTAINFTLCPDVPSGTTVAGRTITLNTAGQSRIQGARPTCS